jgi:ArsR family transcriptional regulator
MRLPHRGKMNERRVLKIAKALSDPTRLRMLREMFTAGEISCGELARRFPISQPTVSHHLKVLEEAGLVSARHEGQFHYFKAVAGALSRFSKDLDASVARPRRAALSARR